MQAQDIDSLKISLRQQPDNQIKLSTYQELTSKIVFSEPEQAVLYGERMLQLAQKINKIESQILANRYIGIALSQQGKYEKALPYFKSTLGLFEESSMREKEKAKVFNNIGLTYSYLRKYSQALTYLNESLVIKQSLMDKLGIANTLNNIGLNYSYIEDYENALYYYLQALDIRKKNGFKKKIASSYINIAGVYYWLEDDERSLEYFDLALSFTDTTKNNFTLLNIFEGKGKTSLGKKDYSAAKSQLQKALKVATSLQNSNAESKQLLLLGQVEMEQGRKEIAATFFKKVVAISDTILAAGKAFVFLGDLKKDTKPEEAEKFYKTGIQVAEKNHSLILERKVNLKLAKLYQNEGNFEQAFLFFEKYKIANDSLFNQQSFNRLQATKIRFETQEKELKITQLENEKEVQQKMIWGTIGALILVLFCALIWFF